jgi:hypothetical protein
LEGSVRASIFACACTVVVACVATLTATPRVRLFLTLEPRSAVPRSIGDAAIVEAASVWAPYGVLVDASDVSDATAPGEVRVPLSVVFDVDREMNPGDEALGAIRFTSDGTPEATITLYYRAVVRLAMSAKALGTEARQWPSGLRDQVIARALGRALAHELGHFVLRSPHHSSSGLMRARQRATALAGSDRKALALTALDQARLRIVLTTPPWTLARAPAAGTIP